MTQGMQEALDAGQAFYSNGENPPFDTAEKIRPEEIKPSIIFLTDTAYFSACLDMADAIYIDNRQIKLPSGVGNFSFSMKVYRGRIRGHNQPYLPKVRYPGDDILDTTAVDKWLGNIVVKN